MDLMGTLARLIELKEHPGSSTWFKDHTVVFSDQAALGTLHRLQLTFKAAIKFKYTKITLDS